mmetsp:Transcript_107151/g.285106  ORF Transcript_107151/g.285106 Transcript_107151/m.285106 type:complete len:463 (-) Transcript_107151:585-1973(-)
MPLLHTLGRRLQLVAWRCGTAPSARPVSRRGLRLGLVTSLLAIFLAALPFPRPLLCVPSGHCLVLIIEAGTLLLLTLLLLARLNVQGSEAVAELQRLEGCTNSLIGRAPRHRRVSGQALREKAAPESQEVRRVLAPCPRTRGLTSARAIRRGSFDLLQRRLRGITDLLQKISGACARAASVFDNNRPVAQAHACHGLAGELAVLVHCLLHALRNAANSLPQQAQLPCSVSQLHNCLLRQVAQDAESPLLGHGVQLAALLSAPQRSVRADRYLVSAVPGHGGIGGGLPDAGARGSCAVGPFGRIANAGSRSSAATAAALFALLEDMRVGMLDLLEAASVSSARLVRVFLAREVPIGLLDLILRHVRPVKTEDEVGVALLCKLGDMLDLISLLDKPHDVLLYRTVLAPQGVQAHLLRLCLELRLFLPEFGQHGSVLPRTCSGGLLRFCRLVLCHRRHGCGGASR